MAGGFIGNILWINLTKKTTGIIDIAKYEEFGGAHGIEPNRYDEPEV